MLYSDNLEVYNETIPSQIADAITQIKRFLQISEEIIIYKYDEYNVALALDLKINLPSKGTFEDIDIREVEPILIIFNLKGYPTTSPIIKSNRKDFPVQMLPHLYAVKDSKAPTLCLVRGSRNEWFANKRVSDVIIVAKQWLSKASSGQLIEDGGEFDPIRLQGYSSYLIYKYSTLLNIIINKFSFFSEQNYAIGLMATFKDQVYVNNNDLSFQFFGYVPFSKSQEFKEITSKNNSDKPENKSNQKLLFGLFHWTDKIYSDYEVQLPSNYIELKDFAHKHDINIEESIDSYIKNDFQVLQGIPLVIGIKRPSKLIEYDGDYEFFHFLISAGLENLKGSIINDDAKVLLLSHREPLSPELARKITGVDKMKKTVFIGAGALGSKVIMNFARGGNFNLTVIDNDKLSPHNLVRHELFMESVGDNKASSIVNKIKDFLLLDSKSTVKSITSSIFHLDEKEEIEKNDWLIDTTASLNVQNWLCNDNLVKIQNRARIELAYRGRLGFLYIEGQDCNPRIDDLINYIYYLSLKIEIISDWLRLEQKKKEGEDYDIVDVGLGCNSATVIMSNDFISFHAAIMSKILANESSRDSIGKSGLINISILSDNGYEVYSENYLIEPFLIFECQNGSNWEIRMLPKVLKKIKKEAKKYGKLETGGIFIGIANYKTKTIHVFDTIKAPKDSKRSSVYFYRGINSLPSQVDYIKKMSGDMIGYIGEWHTHPMGLDKLSSVDLAAVEKLKPLNEKVPIPTFISVLSKNKFLPFVFS